MNNHLPSSDLTIRPASFSDIPFIRSIALKTWPVAYGTILSREQLEYMLERIYSPESLQKQLQYKHYFFLALQNYEAVGFASFSQTEDKTYKLQKLYVLPSCQKSGVGKELLQTVETVAKSMGATRLQLNVNRQNIAKSFYEKNGFQIIREEDIDIGNGFFMNDYVMEKSVNNEQ